MGMGLNFGKFIMATMWYVFLSHSAYLKFSWYRYLFLTLASIPADASVETGGICCQKSIHS